MTHNWPAISYTDCKPTLDTVHRWLQIAGKLRLCKSPWVNHSWGSTLYVTSRGLSTSAIPLGERNLTVEFDFINHEVVFEDSFGLSFVMILQNETVSSFYERFQEALKVFNVETDFFEGPNELPDATLFRDDTEHGTYNPLHAHEIFQALVRVSNVLQEYRADFIGKSSPVHFFWGSFDLAVTRFSGRAAPEHPGGIPHLPDRVVKEAYSHEVMSCGFWPGNDMYPRPAFYAYAYPEPEGFSKIDVPKEAYYHKDLHEFVLDYEYVLASDDPASLIKEFYQAVYLGCSDLGRWDREGLEESPYLTQVRDSLSASTM